MRRIIVNSGNPKNGVWTKEEKNAQEKISTKKSLGSIFEKNQKFYCTENAEKLIKFTHNSNS